MTINNAPKWDRIYLGGHKEIPWNFEEVPVWFREIIKPGWVKSGKALDVGCGLGNYANYLADKGFNVLGIDWSWRAIETCQKKYQKENLEFRVCDALSLKSLGIKFDFILDISLFHHIKPEDRSRYAESLASATNSGARVLICCFSINDEIFQGKSEFYGEELGVTMYALSKEEIVETFNELFEINKLKEVDYGRLTNFKQSGRKKRNLVFMTRK